MSFSTRISVVCGVAVFLVGTGCNSYDDYRAKRAEYAVRHFERAQYSNIKGDKPLSLVECIETALKNNLDLKVFDIQQSVAREMRTAEMLGMLPELNVSNSFTGRNNDPASSSKKVGAEGLSYGASTSQDRNINYLNVDLALSVLDFGLAFMNTQQAEDRVLLRKVQTDRAAQNLTLDVVRAYFEVAAAQRAIGITTKLLNDCRSRYTLIAKMGKSRQITPFRAFDETRRFIDMEKRLTNYIRSYENSCVHLRALMGYYPTAMIKVDDSILDTVPEFKLPDVQLLEQIAFLQRPELYEIDMQKHINVIECRKAILMMFPNVRMFVDFTNSNNSFLYNMSWWEVGIRASYNLLKLPQQIARYQAFSSQVDAEEANAYALAIGVVAQVRIALANMVSTKERFDIDCKVYKAYKENLDWARANKNMTGELSQLEFDHMRLAAAETQIEHYLSLGNYYVSYYRVLNTLGVRHLDKKTVGELSAELEEAKVRAAEELAKEKAEYEKTSAAPDHDNVPADDMKKVEESIEQSPKPPAEAQVPVKLKGKASQAVSDASLRHHDAKAITTSERNT